ncbi:fungal-specific transcription factor domain-containing protein [Thelonectria olida]|uniref:Fungal-specific transcription factor domain-containing protein n=1 Tax=Thelonectria olida TaxID=1576542 RepID=A0A9P8VVD3_9HYPO|nr:fungal-specific transcription factor domain-containing protein [Thelonectria olida]
MDTSSEADTLRRTKSLHAVQACLRCREKKTRCDGNKPACQSCIARGQECSYSQVQKRRGPGKGKKEMQALQKRVSEMESLLNRSGLLERNEAPEAGRDASLKPGDSSTALPSCIINISASPSVGEGGDRQLCDQEQPNADSAEPLSSHAAGLQNTGTTDISRGAMFSLFGFTHEKTDEHKAVNNPMSLSPVVAFPVLPGEAHRHLVRFSIGDICYEFPLLHLPWLYSRLTEPDPLERHDKSWWALLNTLIAMGIVSKGINSSFRETSADAWGFFKNAYAVFPHLVLQGNEFLTVQALLAMAIFMMWSADTRTTALILSTAVRELQTIGLHGGICRTIGGEPVADEMRSRVIWLTFILDMEMSSNCGLPPSQSDEDIDIGLPEDRSLDRHSDMTNSEEGGDKVFRPRVELAIIQARIRRGLYTAKSRRQSTDQLLGTVHDLDPALEHWRSIAPVALQSYNSPQDGDCALDKSLVSLSFAYYHCISMVHWAVLRSKIQQSAVDGAARDHAMSIPQLQVIASTAKVRVAARAMIAMIRRVSPQPFTELWRFLRYPISACLTLLGRVLDDPAGAEAQCDLKAIRWFRQFIQKMVREEDCDLNQVLHGCIKMEEIASTAMADAVKEPSPDLSLNERREAIASLLGAATHPMFIAQGLMGNLPNSDAEIARTLSGYLGLSWEENPSYGSFVPESLRPEAYGFVFKIE